MADNDKTTDITALTVELLQAYLANNTIPSDDLAELIRTTRIALAEDAKAEVAVPEETFTPAVTVRKSLASSAHILSLIDGKPYKTLKRHLAANGLTPDTYRARYNLPATYPMVAADFAAMRSEIAQRIGLGNRSPAAAGGSGQVAAEASRPDAAVEKSMPEPTVKAKTVKRSAAKTPKAKAVQTGPKAKGRADAEVSKAAVDAPKVAEAAPGAPASAKPTKSETRSKSKSVAPSAAAKRAQPRSKAKGDGGKATGKPDATQAPTAGLVADEAKPSEASTPKAASKPRGKLGLFGKKAAGPDAG